MNMKINLDTSIDNLLYLEYMEKLQQEEAAESNEDQNNSWYWDERPHDQKEN